MDIKLFPTNNANQFTKSEVEHLYTTFVTWNIPDNNTFGPYEVVSFVIGYPYNSKLAHLMSMCKLKIYNHKFLAYHAILYNIYKESGDLTLSVQF